VVGMTPTGVQFGPQHAPRDGAHRCRRAGHVRLPPIDRWASGLVPGVGMRVAQPIPMLPEAATGHQARVQRPVPHHLWISGLDPLVPVWTTSLSPPAQMGRAQPGVAARTHTPGHRAPGRPENRIRHGGHQHLSPKLPAHRCAQTRNPAGLDRRRQRLDAHHDPSRSASHPAATNARRVSSTFRCA
jgi:hypothetical protein